MDLCKLKIVNIRFYWRGKCSHKLKHSLINCWQIFNITTTELRGETHKEARWKLQIWTQLCRIMTMSGGWAGAYLILEHINHRSFCVGLTTMSMLDLCVNFLQPDIICFIFHFEKQST